jgi:hypothetical protein
MVLGTGDTTESIFDISRIRKDHVAEAEGGMRLEGNKIP